MTKSELDAIRARADAATEGPWTVAPVPEFRMRSVRDEEKPDWAMTYQGIGPVRGWTDQEECENPDVWLVCDSPGDAPFIAAARTDVPALCDALEAAMEALAVASELLDTGNYYDDDARENGQQLLRQWRVD